LSASTLTRWSGLAAMLGATLSILTTIVSLLFTLFFSESTPTEVALAAIYAQAILSLLGGSLLILGLVGLYVRQLEDTGVVGLIGFLVTFFGLTLALASVAWTDLLSAFGWALFGAGTLQAGIYPRPAATLLVIGAVAAGLFGPLLAGFGGMLGYVGAGAPVVLNVAIAWLGLSLFTGRGLASTENQRLSKEG
jgi:hypothetical protein